MNKPTLKEQILRQYIRSLIKESLLTEKFVSPTLTNFVREIGSKSKLEINKVLRGLGIAWDQIPESAVTVDSSMSSTIKKAVNDQSKIIIWFSPDKRQLVKWKPATYNKYGHENDHSIYLRPNTVVVTQGKNYLVGYGNLANKPVATDRYAKPLDGAMSVTKLMVEIEAIALIIDVNAVKAADTTPLQQSRRDSKFGATALQRASDILSANRSHYKQLLQKGKAQKMTAGMTERVSKAVEKLKAQIETAAQSTIENLINYRDNSGYGTDPDYPLTQTPKAGIGKIDYVKLEAATTKYNDLINAYANYIDYSKIYASRSGYHTKGSYERRIEELEQILSSIE